MNIGMQLDHCYSHSIIVHSAFGKTMIELVKTNLIYVAYPSAFSLSCLIA